MASSLTILIPTHNRPNYLQRTIAYYSNWKYPVLILDSSLTAYELESGSVIQYIHLPGISLPEKLYYGFSNVATEFTVMCADDDFLVADGVETCLHFLQANRQYAAADGGIIFYKKQDIFKTEINYNLLYKQGLDEDYREPNALQRLKMFFKHYRTLFYGVHYTHHLKYIYENCRLSFNNLYLNEYLTVLFPVVKGYCRVLPVLTAVRESTPTSDDKNTVNLDRMFDNKVYETELNNYIHCVATAIHQQCNVDLKQSIETITNVLSDYANTISVVKQNEQQQYLSFTKKVGGMVLKVPLIGTAIVGHRRRKQSRNEIAVLIKTPEDKSNLHRISQYIQQYRSIC